MSFPRLRRFLIKTGKYLLYSLLAIVLVFFILHLCFPLKVKVQYSNIVTDADGQVMHAFLAPDQRWRMFTELKEITPELEKAIVFKEDRFFYYHPGFNLVAMARAGFNNLLHRKRTSGASTITMQVARLLYPAERSYLNKISEIFRAMQLELKYSKKEILQLYLNLVPYGGNVEGVKSASMLYLKKTPGLMSLAEITTLAIIPNRPSSLKLGMNNDYIMKERNKWLERFREAGLFDKQAIDDALAEPLEAKRHEAPHMAPHLSIRLQRQYKQSPIIRTWLKQNTQLKVEQMVSNYINRIRSYNILNAAVLVVNNRTHQVEAYVGSADFNNTVDGGQVDGVTALRSPGSTLKPLLYASCFDAGLITPKSVINDVPTSFNGYEPENYEKQFSGRISIENALALSLNIPAVKMLDKQGTRVFTRQLKKAGFTYIGKNEDHFGLSLILGGCGVKLEELTGLFSSFANKGIYSNLQLSQADTSRVKVKIISQEAAYMTTEILTRITRPDLPNNYRQASRVPRIAWKTGTSYGRRDAWSIGYNKSYTVGVWVGNFSGLGVPELSGANIATPLLFEIFNAIDYNSPGGWFVAPKGLDYRYVCSESGMVPSEFCENQVMDVFIPAVSPVTPCRHKKPVYVNSKGTMSYCADCMPNDAVQKLYQNYDPELITYFVNRHIPYEKLPPHNPACVKVFSNQAPQITSPVDGAEYFIEADDPQKMALSCHTGNDVSQVYWYVNDKLIGSCRSSEQFFYKPKAGKTRISCTDDKGRTRSIVVFIKPV